MDIVWIALAAWFGFLLGFLVNAVLTMSKEAEEEQIGYELELERKDWARRFKLNDVTPWDWMTRAEQAERERDDYKAHFEVCDRQRIEILQSWLTDRQKNERERDEALAALQKLTDAGQFAINSDDELVQKLANVERERDELRRDYDDRTKYIASREKVVEELRARLTNIGITINTVEDAARYKALTEAANLVRGYGAAALKIRILRDQSTAATPVELSSGPSQEGAAGSAATNGEGK